MKNDIQKTAQLNQKIRAFLTNIAKIKITRYILQIEYWSDITHQFIPEKS